MVLARAHLQQQLERRQRFRRKRGEGRRAASSSWSGGWSEMIPLGEIAEGVGVLGVRRIVSDSAPFVLRRAPAPHRLREAGLGAGAGKGAHGRSNRAITVQFFFFPRTPRFLSGCNCRHSIITRRSLREMGQVRFNHQFVVMHKPGVCPSLQIKRRDSVASSNLRGRNLRGRNLRRAQGATCAGGNLRGRNLRGRNLNLRGRNLRDTALHERQGLISLHIP